jgi:hypothetical protein
MPSKNDDLILSSREKLTEMGERIRPLSQASEEQMLGSSPTPYELTAHHESSHAVTAVKLGIVFDYVSVSLYLYTARSGDNIGGLHFAQDFAAMLHARNPASAADREEIENLVVVAIAGEAGQAFLEQRECDMKLASASGDLAIVMLLANWLFADTAERNAFIGRQTIAACELVSNRVFSRQIECVATILPILCEMSYDAVVARMKIRGPVRARRAMRAKRKNNG